MLGLRQHAGLQHELQVHQTACALLQVQPRRVTAVQLGPHARAHLQHVTEQRVLVAHAAQGAAAYLLEIGQQ